MYRIRRKTRLTVLLLTALVSHFTVERSFRQILRTSAWFDLTHSTYSDDQWYASFRVSKNTFQFLLLIRMWRTLNNWRGAPWALKNVTERYRKKGERLHVEKKTKMWVRNRFLSVPFRKGSIAAYGPFQERNGYNWNGSSTVYTSNFVGAVRLFIRAVPISSLVQTGLNTLKSIFTSCCILLFKPYGKEVIKLELRHWKLGRVTFRKDFWDCY